MTCTKQCFRIKTSYGKTSATTSRTKPAVEDTKALDFEHVHATVRKLFVHVFDDVVKVIFPRFFGCSKPKAVDVRSVPNGRVVHKVIVFDCLTLRFCSPSS